jgi:hypothetical protein
VDPRAARWLSGDVGHAIEDTLACLGIKESLGDLHTITMAIDLLAVCLVAQEDFAQAAGLCGPATRSGRCCTRPSSKARITEIRRSAAETLSAGAGRRAV